MSAIHRMALGLVLLLPFVRAPYRAAAAACAPTRNVIARGLGSPDDLAVRGGTIYFTDESAGALAALSGGRVRIVARGFKAPEGIVLEAGGRALIAEQGANRIDQVQLSTGRWSVVIQLANTTGRDGIDRLGAGPGGQTYVPDSPYGSLWLLDARRHLHLVASGLGRPVGALRYAGGVAVPDETANAVWYIRGSQAVRMATVPIPDDVDVVGSKLVAVTLGDGALWEMRPHVRRLLGGFGQPQGLAALGNGSVVVADSTTNTIVRVDGLGACS